MEVDSQQDAHNSAVLGFTLSITQICSGKKTPLVFEYSFSFQAYTDNEYKYSLDLPTCLSYICWNIEDLRETFKINFYNLSSWGEVYPT